MSSQDKNETGSISPDEKLFSEFPGSSYEQWKAEAEALLKGAPFEKRLFTPTHEGITLRPIYNKEDISSLPYINSYPGFAPYLRGSEAVNKNGGGWEIAQEINYADYEEFNRALMNDLERGLTAITLPLDCASRDGCDPDQAAKGSAGYGGVSISSLIGFSRALRGVDLKKYPLYIQSGICGPAFLGLYASLARKNSVDWKDLKGAVAIDPLGELALTGKLRHGIGIIYDQMVAMTLWAENNAPDLGTVWIHGEPYSEGGAHAVQELAYVLAVGVEYLRELEKRELPPEKSASHFRFSFAQGSNFFMEVAKLRAARILWNKILEECGVDEENRKMRIHTRTSRYTKTVYDPYVNILRSTVETFSGIIGGADSAHSAPFDEQLGPADEFSRRIARNIQVILKEEAHLADIIDPAGGSWYIESLTAEIANSAWNLFRKIESMEGMHQALKADFPQKEIASAAQKKAQSYALRRNILVGTNRYPNPTEDMPKFRSFDYDEFQNKRSRRLEELRTSSEHKDEITVLNKLEAIMNASAGKMMEAVIEAAEHGATVGEISRILCAGKNSGETITAIAPLRASEPFEMLRLAVEKERKSKGGLKVCLATLGPVGKYMPRLDFSASFFEIGGFEVVRTQGYASSDEAARRALDEKAEIVLICGLDDSYPENAPKIAENVKKENPKAIVVLAGLPPDDDLKKKYTDSGIDLFIHVKSDVLRTLTDIAERLGVRI